jgi:thioredoxin-related protein
MTRRISLLAVLALALSTPAFAGGTWHKSVAAAQKAAKEKDQLILVDMFAQWCGWCHRFEREVFPSEVFQKATDDMVLLRLDTEDRGEGTQYAQKFGVSQLPTFRLLSPDLTLAGVINGYAPPQQFVAMLEEKRTEYTTFKDLVKNEAKYAKDYKQRFVLAKGFSERAQYDKSTPRFQKLMTEKGVPADIRDAAYYELAVTLMYQRKLEESMKTVRALTAMSKTGQAVEQARFLAAQIYIMQSNLLGAATELRALKKNHPNSQLIRSVDMILPDIERRLAAGGK